MTTIITIYGLVAVAFGLSIWKDKSKTLKAFKVAGQSSFKMAPSLLTILGVVGLILGILTPELLSKLVGEEAGFMATGIAAILGAITLIPSLVAFPLAGSLLRSGATYMTIAAFITTLVMVGTITAPMEIKSFGKKFTILRNGFSFVAAIIIALIMGLIL
ncbi:MAG: permease [Petrotogales bacterium]